MSRLHASAIVAAALGMVAGPACSRSALPLGELNGNESSGGGESSSPTGGAGNATPNPSGTGGFDPGTGGFDPGTGGSGPLPVDCPLTPDTEGYFFTLDGDGGTQLLTSGCEDAPYPFLIAIHGECRPSFRIRACGAGDLPSLELNRDGRFTPGPDEIFGADTYEDAVVTYRRSDGTPFVAQNGTVVLNEVTNLTAVGQANATVVAESSGESMAITMDFLVCRLPDIFCP